ncbi:MAG: tRNA pseudouridine32 synthase/23S rRNA pseudouridine746 synthase [Rhodothermales bacterium]|jgi:tRNA pseudouridine32 synthase/23S rRNA pseudouridine746 synthase
MSEPVTIIHEDPGFVVVVKASGFLSVPGRQPQHKDCVTNRIRQRYPQCIEHPMVHRLDMDTSGLMVVALTKASQRHLSIQFQERLPKKRYEALLDGILDAENGTIELPFRLDVDNRPHQIYDEVHGKMGLTHWRRLSVENGQTRVCFVPVTGRTHQLRLHAAHEKGLGLPIVGDPLYGRGRGPGEMKLHACELSFLHPVSEAPVSFSSSVPF